MLKILNCHISSEILKKQQNPVLYKNSNAELCGKKKSWNEQISLFHEVNKRLGIIFTWGPIFEDYFFHSESPRKFPVEGLCVIFYVYRCSMSYFPQRTPAASISLSGTSLDRSPRVRHSVPMPSVVKYRSFENGSFEI